MTWTGLLVFSANNAQGALSFQFAVGVFVGFYVWLFFTIIISSYGIILLLIGKNLRKQLLRLVMSYISATVTPLVLLSIMSSILDSLVDATPYENGGTQYLEIVDWIFFFVPSASVFIGFALGWWWYQKSNFIRKP